MFHLENENAGLKAENAELRAEVMQLKHRLQGFDAESDYIAEIERLKAELTAIAKDRSNLLSALKFVGAK